MDHPHPLFDEDVPVIWKWMTCDEVCRNRGSVRKPVTARTSSVEKEQLSPRVNNPCDDEDEEGESDPSHDDSVNDDFDDDNSEESFALFKCLGTTKQKGHQDALRNALEKIHNKRDVPVRVAEEPDNEVDTNAVAFQVQLDGKWERIGYVASELAVHVKEAESNNAIQSLQIKWIKYRYWPKSGFGFYTAIKITRKGRWQHDVYLKSSS